MSLRISRRNAAEPPPVTEEPEAPDDAPSASGWKSEIDAITNGTHPALVAELAMHQKTMKSQIAQAERLKNAQAGNIDALFDCDIKQVDDEYKAQLEFFQSRLIDSLEQKHRKLARQAGFRIGRRPSETGKTLLSDAKRKKMTGDSVNFMLKPEECKSDIEEILRNVDHYTVRSAALASDESRHNANDVWYDRSRLQVRQGCGRDGMSLASLKQPAMRQLNCHGASFERGAAVTVLHNGQPVDDEWTITAMNAVEATLRATDGSKLKVTLSQLRNGRYALHSPAS